LGLIHEEGGRKKEMANDTDLQLIQRARQHVDEGFYVNNLRDLVDLFQEPSLVTRWPTVLFVLRTITLNIIYEWDKQPVISDDADKVRAQLQPLFRQVLDLLVVDASAAKIYAALDDVVLAWTKLSV
jgi:hypothetical protein